MDPLESFKAAQREGWSHFAPLEALTTPEAARLVAHARIEPGQRVLDVACGTGVVAVTAARAGAHVTALDLTPALLARARENASIAAVDVEFHEGDVEQMPFPDAAFDVVVSQFGHIFAPRAEVALAEMLRVLKPGGTIAFSTWPPELFLGNVFAVAARYMPPPPPGISAPPQWGDPNIVRQRLGTAVKDIAFDRATMLAPALSPQHYRTVAEQTSGPIMKLVAALSSEPERLAAFRRDYEAAAMPYLKNNVMRLDYLMSRATKV